MRTTEEISSTMNERDEKRRGWWIECLLYLSLIIWQTVGGETWILERFRVTYVLSFLSHHFPALFSLTSLPAPILRWKSIHPQAWPSINGTVTIKITARLWDLRSADLDQFNDGMVETRTGDNTTHEDLIHCLARAEDYLRYLQTKFNNWVALYMAWLK